MNRAKRIMSMITRTYVVGGPLGSHPDVGICRGVPRSQSAPVKGIYVADFAHLSLQVPGIIQPYVTLTESVSDVTHADQ